MAERITVMDDVIDPEVMGDIVGAKLDAQLQHIQYAKVNNTLVGRPGDTLTLPKWNYIGPAEERGELEEVDVRNMSQESVSFQVKKLIVSVALSEETKISGLGKPADYVERQLRMSLQDKVNMELVAAAFKTPQILNGTRSGTVTNDNPTKIVDFDGLVDCSTGFGDESDEVRKIMFINPAQEKHLLADTDIREQMKFNGDVARKGFVGFACGMHIKKSHSIPLINCESATSGTSGAIQITEELFKKKTYKYWDATDKKVVIPAVGDYVKVLAVPYYKNQIIKLEPDDDSTEYTENEFAALTIVKKQDVKVNYKYLDTTTCHRFTAHMFAGHALTNEAKVEVANFRAAPAA